MADLKPHQLMALADTYARWRGYMGQVVSIWSNPTTPEQGQRAAWEWNIQRIQAEAMLGELWVIPCRGGKTRSALNVLLYWQDWLAEWGVPELLRRMWHRPHLVITESDLIRDTVFPAEWEKVRPAWVSRKVVPVPTDETWRLAELRPGDIGVTTYHTLLHRPAEFHTVNFGVVVADEVHRLKNPETKWVNVAYSIESVARLGMSATPFTNWAHELIHVLLWLQGYNWNGQRVSPVWPSAKVWRERYCAWRWER